MFIFHEYFSINNDKFGPLPNFPFSSQARMFILGSVFASFSPISFSKKANDSGGNIIFNLRICVWINKIQSLNLFVRHNLLMNYSPKLLGADLRLISSSSIKCCAVNSCNNSISYGTCHHPVVFLFSFFSFAFYINNLSVTLTIYPKSLFKVFIYPGKVIGFRQFTKSFPAAGNLQDGS